jgi:hypothetical protein
MKNKFLIFLLMLLMGITIFGRLANSQASNENSTNKAEEIFKKAQALDQAGTNIQALSPEEIKALEQYQREHRNEVIEYYVRQSNVPIEFYGKVVDQNDRPLSGAKIKTRIRHWILAAPNTPGGRTKEHVLISDENGSFILTKENGDALTIAAIEKEGYELSKKAKRSYSYKGTSEIFTPDSDNPVVFKMWKQQGAEKLIKGDKFYGIIPDGRQYTLNLLYGQKIEGDSSKGDLKVTIERPAQITPRTPYDWSFTIEGINGGVIETADEFMYLAPESGYQPKYQFSMNSTHPKWSDKTKKQFYLSSRDRKFFGRMEVDVYSSYRDQAVFDVHYFLNTNGSRNLEYDPLLQTKR